MRKEGNGRNKREVLDRWDKAEKKNREMLTKTATGLSSERGQKGPL